MTDPRNILPFVTPDEKKVVVPPDKKLEKEEKRMTRRVHLTTSRLPRMNSTIPSRSTSPVSQRQIEIVSYSLIFVFYLRNNAKPEFFTNSL